MNAVACLRPGRIKCQGYELVCNGGVVVTII